MLGGFLQINDDGLHVKIKDSFMKIINKSANVLTTPEQYKILIGENINP
jgi:hypothetical protein